MLQYFSSPFFPFIWLFRDLYRIGFSDMQWILKCLPILQNYCLYNSFWFISLSSTCFHFKSNCSEKRPMSTLLSALGPCGNIKISSNTAGILSKIIVVNIWFISWIQYTFLNGIIENQIAGLNYFYYLVLANWVPFLE